MVLPPYLPLTKAGRGLRQQDSLECRIHHKTAQGESDAEGPVKERQVVWGECMTLGSTLGCATDLLCSLGKATSSPYLVLNRIS